MLTFNDKTMTYDENGNLTSVTNSCGTTTYTWDPRNRLIAINGFASALTSTSTCEALAASFKYDALGRRIERSINGRTIQYLYDGQDIVQGIEGGQVAVNYIRTLNVDEPLARVESSGVVRYYQQDALGSVIALADETGNIKTQYVYDPFGNTNISGEASDNPFQYTGRENDLSAVAQAGGTGLYYYRARYYSPELQRFISEDPIKFEGGDVNFYAYVANNPVSRIDPFGLWYIDINLSYGKILGVTGGIMIGKEGIYPYFGGGIVLAPGFSVTWSPSNPTTGWNEGFQFGIPKIWVGGQRGYSYKGDEYFWEVGFANPGLSFTDFYVWNPWKWPWKEECK